LQVFFGLDALALATVDHSYDASALLGFGDNHFQRVCRGGKNVAYLGHGFDFVEDVYGVGVSHQDKEAVAAGNFEGFFAGEAFEFDVVSFDSNKAWSAAFTEGQTELHSW